ncbi:hypothetical protein LEN26_010095 [Aphanomyces euteiches]|nr:hypothetical protein AeMF1_012123 [Aphanomyces euteiches]KAH9122795.1 hypothetical protein LEN26_010095 [Aphanomyces euteiches]
MAFSFGGSTTGTAAPLSFGTTPAPAAPGGFSFGSSNTAANTSTTTSGTTPGFSFGSTTNPSTTATGGGFNFGSMTGTTAAPATTTAPSTGLGFGTTSATPATTGFGFGASSTTPAPSTGFGFGSTTTNNATSGFGATANSTSLFSKPSTGLSFGGTSAPAFGTSSFGTSTTTPGFGAAPAPAVSLDMRFENLPAEVQKQLKEFDAFLKEQSREEASIRSVSAQRLSDLKDATQQLEQVALVMRNLQTRQAKEIDTLKSDVKDVVSQAEAADQIHIHLTSDTGIQRKESMPSEYYWTLLRDFEQRMITLKAQMADVHIQLQGLQQNRNERDAAMTSPLLIQQILQSQNDAFMKIAAHVAQAHEQADALRDQYLAMLQRKQNGGKVRNPFDAADRIQAEEERRVVDRIRLSAAHVSLPTAGATSAAPVTTSAFGNTTTPSFGGFGASTTAPTTSGFGSFGSTATTAPATTSAFGTAPATSAFGAPATSAFGSTAAAGGVPAQPTLTKSVSFAGLGSSTITPTVDAGNAFGMAGAPGAANTLNTKSIRRKSSSTKKR